jgi:succinate-acetate transporter protein
VATTAFGFWFVGLAAITWTGTIAAVAENLAVSLVLLTLAAGSTFLAIGLIGSWSPLETTGAYLLLVSALVAWYTASAMLLEATYKRAILPMGKRGAAPAVPGQRPTEPIEYQFGEPGVKAGQ